jgi:predicted signal transduction protein with EAL and GGDEF domain
MPLHFFYQPTAVTFAVTSAAVALSVAVAQATMWLVGYDAGYLPALLAGAIPAVMVPFTVYPLADSNRRLRKAQGELERIALTDVLTDLPNRRAFFESAEAMFTTPSTADHPVAALMIDVDHFNPHSPDDTVICYNSAAIRL